MAVSRRTLGQAITEVLYCSHSSRHRGPAERIVNTIFKAIIKALQREERVTIEGLGAFYIRTYTHHYKDGTIQRWKKVRFIPARSLYLSLLDKEPEDNGNHSPS